MNRIMRMLKSFIDRDGNEEELCIVDDSTGL